MFSKLSETQKRIVFEKSGRLVVRACPGSGKTYSVAARLAYRIQNWKTPNAGMAAISFTNTAWEEINEKLVQNFNIQSVSYPHFLGTIDSFINNFIFLPHGHLVMGCRNRPILVGQPHSNWTIKRYDNDYDQYFDIVSLGCDNELIYPEIQGVFFFGFNKIFKQDGEESQHAANLREMKRKFWEKGYANQHDANFFALRILERYPHIAKAVSFRFNEMILDEAQDTNNIQMRILEILCQQGLYEVILVGDPDQAIFEWNKAKPKLFQAKFEEWKENSLILNENRRSSSKICSTTFHLSTLDRSSEAVDENVKDFEFNPEIVVFNSENVQAIIGLFIDKCEKQGIIITPSDVAIVCRSKNFIDEILGESPIKDLMWTEDYKISYPIVHAAFLLAKGLTKKAYKILEAVWVKHVLKKEIISRSDIDYHIERTGFIEHRSQLYNFFKNLPKCAGNLGLWVDEANKFLANLTLKIVIVDESRDLPIERLFSLAEEEIDYLDYSIGTVHSVKGQTFEAVLLFLKTRGVGRNYTTLINGNIPSDEEEELRIVYVGITRPRKILMIAVPNEVNKIAWEKKLCL